MIPFESLPDGSIIKYGKHLLKVKVKRSVVKVKDLKAKPSHTGDYKGDPEIRKVIKFKKASVGQPEIKKITIDADKWNKRKK